MKLFITLISFTICLQLAGQDSLMNVTGTSSTENARVKIFNSERTINANTTETVGRGKMEFKVTHNFDDIDGAGGILNRFLGLDNARDIRIGFHVGLTDRLDVALARVKGAGAVTKLFELSAKCRILDQAEKSHPAVAIFINTVVSSAKASALANFENSFRGFSDRLSQTFQLIIAQKIGNMSIQLNPTYVHTNYVILNDDDGIFALGGAVKFPLTRNFNLIVDYFHPFRSESSKAFFKTVDNTYAPPGDVVYNPVSLRFYDPLGIGLEILTAGHIFHLNFTNTTDILENRFIPRTTTSWTKGQWRWSFSISRAFALWRSKG